MFGLPFGTWIPLVDAGPILDRGATRRHHIRTARWCVVPRIGDRATGGRDTAVGLLMTARGPWRMSSASGFSSSTLIRGCPPASPHDAHGAGRRDDPEKVIDVTPALPTPDDTAAARAAERRRRVFAATVAARVARGARIASRGEFDAVLARGLRLHNNHGLTITGGETYTVVTVDEHGNAFERRIPPGQVHDHPV
jgi:hypothetical protein